MGTRTLDYTETVTIIDCPQCHMEFGIPRNFEKRRRDDHKSFYCPQGHTQYFPEKSEAEKLKEQLETARNSEEFWRVRSKREEEAKELARRQRDAYKGHTTRLKRRVAKGKCPSCSSDFPDLAAHMAEAHPEYAGVEADG